MVGLMAAFLVSLDLGWGVISGRGLSEILDTFSAFRSSTDAHKVRKRLILNRIGILEQIGVLICTIATDGNASPRTNRGIC